MAINLHPSDHPPSALDTTEFDLVVIGAGPTGENVASRAIAGGLSVAVVEAELVGGECSYWACMPSKGLLRTPEAAAEARAVGAEAGFDPAAVLARRDTFNSHFDDHGQVDWLTGAGATLVRGTGRLSGVRTVAVDGHDGSTVELTARHAVALCTGSTALIPPIDGLDAVRPWTSREATSAEQAPGRLLVLGGGVVGVEMATAWHALGSAVSVLESAEHVLPPYEPRAGEMLGAALADRGVTVRTGARVVSARRDVRGVTVTLDGGEQLSGDELLVATGRRPHPGLGVDTVGLDPDRWLAVDDTMTVLGVEGGWLYAVGDGNDRAKLTHIGKYEARITGDVIVARARGARLDDAPWGKHVATATHGAVPQVVFTDPQVGSVGLTERAAREAGINTRTVDYDMGSVAGAALFADGYRGWANLVVDTEREVVVGATFVGSGAGELVQSATIAIVGEVPLSRLWHAVPSYPTISEIWLRLLETWGL
jgi:pyruvate/2-oxoglutarate dehydrogenase complex dihydrolipoamide dehydrogenase (E3) component